MKKLTLEKAREILEFLQGKAAEGDITLAQENYLQAMELAVMALSAKVTIPDRSMLRKLVDLVWNEAKESTEVPSTKFADQLIDTVFPASTAKPEAL